MAWTTPVLCGAAALVSSADIPFSFYSNLLLEDEDGVWANLSLTQEDVEGDTIKLTNWTVEIPGAGANVTSMKITVQGWENIPGTLAQLYARGFGITTVEKETDIGGQIYTTKTIVDTVENWGISAAEIDLLVSNSGGNGLEIRMDANDWENSTVRIRNVLLSFEYNDRRRIFIT